VPALDLTRPQVHVAGRVPPAILGALGTNFELVEHPEGVDGVLSLLTTAIDDAYLERAGGRLRIVANYAAGTDNVDVAAARRRGIVVTNTPDVLTRPTAELALGLLLSLMRRITEGDHLIRSGAAWKFEMEFMLGESLDEKLVGIVGAGRIGRETARLVEAFGATVSFAGRTTAFPDWLAELDVVSLHGPLTPETFHLIDARALAAMKSTAVLVNTARGAVVDEHALVHALRAGSIGGAALDVYEFEPAVTTGLLALENVVLSPHLGSATRRAREAMGMLAVDALRAVLLEGRQPSNAVF
jgi:glyoxylate reductase